jgi:hypothetical protein
VPRGRLFRTLVLASLSILALTIVNREYWKDYPNFDPTKTFAITPRVICRLIQNALKKLRTDVHRTASH